MRDILTNAAIGGGILVASVLLTNFFITVPGQVKFICFILALVNGLCLVAKVSLTFNRYKMLLLVFLSLAALVGVLANTFILQGAFVPLEANQMLYVAILTVIIGGLHYLTRRKS
jgi:P-ATPase superfamily cation transporter ATPase